MEYENVKEALRALIDLRNGKGLIINDHLATGKEAQEYAIEVAIEIADLLGMSELYLHK